jgi:hypothetical protein
MTSPAARSRSRAERGAPGLKALITAAALAATLLGWIGIALGQPRQTASAPAQPSAAAAQPSTGLLPPQLRQPLPPLLNLRSVGAPPPLAITRSSR